MIAGHLAGLANDERTLLQAASIQGEQFLAEVAARVLGLGEEQVLRQLSGPLKIRHRLVEAVSLERLPSSGQRLSRYRFRHALLQRGAYHTLDAVERARLHEATGRALEALHAAEGEPSERPPHSAARALAPELARHFEEAGMPMEAARQRLAAGRWAVWLLAYDEAVAHLERGLALLEGVAPSRDRLRLELGQAGQFYGGLLEVLAAPAQDGRADAEAGAAPPAAGSGLGQASRLLVRAEMLQSAGQAEAALQVTDGAMAWVEGTGVRTLEAEVRRKRGELLLLLAEKPDGSPGPLSSGKAAGEAEACFHRALEVARAQEARLLELRTAVSLARLWQAQGRRGEARELLAGIYGWFSEGFDTVDLTEARALLEELA